VDNPTLNRFFSLHYLLPFMMVGVVILHVWALHVTGQTNPTGVEVKSKTDTVPFTPYATVKDAFALWCSSGVRLFRLLTCRTSSAMRQLHRGQPAGDAGAHRAGMVLPAVLRDPARHHLQHRPDRLQAWRRACHVRFDAVLFVLPWLDTSKVRSAVYRPWYKLFFWIFVANAIFLGWLGAKPAEGIYTPLAQISTLYYFAFFLVILPVLGLIETPKRLPNSITEAVLAKKAGNGGAAAARGVCIRCGLPDQQAA
jgi:ubiquinol-cytochrome c reductase cytochrome b subunit